MVGGNNEAVSDLNNWNTKIIDEFRANAGKVGGQFESVPLLLLHTTGARSGKERINPLAYQDLGGSIAVFASKAGADTHPDWFHNVTADPAVTVEVAAKTGGYRARVATGAERETVWTKQKLDYPGFAGYEAKTSREIPVIILDPA